MTKKISTCLIMIFCMTGSAFAAAVSKALPKVQEVDLPVYGKVVLPVPSAMGRIQALVLQDKAFGPLHMTQVCVKPTEEGLGVTATVNCLGARLHADCVSGSRCFELTSLDGRAINILGLHLKNVQLIPSETSSEAIIAGDLELPTGLVKVHITMSEFGPLKTDFSIQVTDPSKLPQAAKEFAQQLAVS